MRECPKCHATADDQRKICRACGAALGPIIEDLPSPTDPSPSPHQEEAPPEADVSAPSWKCPQCGELVPGNFEICWNCRIAQDETPDPDFRREPQDETATPQSPGDACPKCGSTKIIRGASVIDHFTTNLRAAVHTDPAALFFKDSMFAALKAHICGNCGHVELKAEHPKELYEHYLQSKKGDTHNRR